MSTFIDKPEKSWEFEAIKIMFKLMDEYPEFSGDDFYRLCREIGMPAHFIKKFSGSNFRCYQASGHICKTGKVKLSERNNSSLLVVWKRCAIDTKPLSELSSVPV